MSQAALVQARLHISGLPAGSFRFDCDPLVSPAPNFQQQIVKVAAGTFVTLAIPPLSVWLFLGFDPTNLQAVRVCQVAADQGIWVGPTGWVSLAVPYVQTAGQMVVTNAGGGSDVMMQVVVV